MKRRSRRRLLLLIGSALAALVFLTWLAYAQGIVVIQKRQVAVPPVTASPRVVVRFTETLDAHDCATARRLWVDPSSADVWCRDVLSLMKVRVHKSFPEKPQWSGHRKGQQIVQQSRPPHQTVDPG